VQSVRACAPHAWIAAPPVVLGTVALTQPGAGTDEPWRVNGSAMAAVASVATVMPRVNRSRLPSGECCRAH
jgi:hypothetical protein